MLFRYHIIHNIALYKQMLISRPISLFRITFILLKVDSCGTCWNFPLAETATETRYIFFGTRAVSSTFSFAFKFITCLNISRKGLLCHIYLYIGFIMLFPFSQQSYDSMSTEVDVGMCVMIYCLQLLKQLSLCVVHEHPLQEEDLKAIQTLQQEIFVFLSQPRNLHHYQML